MNQLQAMRDTIDFAKKCGMEDTTTGKEELSFPHLLYMLEQMERGQGFSKAKMGRWLGYAQAVVIAQCSGARLIDMKMINERNS